MSLFSYFNSKNRSLTIRVLTLTLLCGSAFSVTADMTVNLGGRIQLDAALYDEDVTELGSGTEFRRARFFVNGDIDDNWDYKLQIDFADGEVDLKDAFVRFDGLNLGKIKVGHFKTPFSLEEMTSSKYITFMERAMPNAFATSRRIGVGLDNVSGNRTFSAALYGDSAADSGDDEGLGLAARFTTAPQFGEGRFAHFGAALAYEEPTNTGSSTVRFRARPESHVTSSRLVNGGTIADVSNITKFGLEAAYVTGPFSVQAEYITASVDAANSGDPDYDGYYVYASYFPWGGTRAYKNGAFGRVKAFRTWEFAVRYSSIDLNDTGGGEQNNITLGANYYINPYLRLMGNYVLTDVEDGINGDEDPSVLQFRIAMDFK